MEAVQPPFWRVVQLWLVEFWARSAVWLARQESPLPRQARRRLLPQPQPVLEVVSVPVVASEAVEVPVVASEAVLAVAHLPGRARAAVAVERSRPVPRFQALVAPQVGPLVVVQATRELAAASRLVRQAPGRDRSPSGQVAVQTVAVWGQAPRVGRWLAQRAEPSAPEVPSPAQEKVRRGRRARQLIGCRRFWMSQLEHRAITG